MITLYIARHCETAWNAEKRMQGWSDSPPSLLGESQAFALADRMKSVHLDRICSSPTGRAYFTAETVSLRHTIPVEKEDRIREINLGRWEGRLESELKDVDAERYHSFWKNPAGYVSDSGESFSDVAFRMRSFLDEIAGGADGRTVLALSHTVAIKMLCLSIWNRPVSDIWLTPSIAPTALTEIRIDNGEAEIVSFADSSHLA